MKAPAYFVSEYQLVMVLKGYVCWSLERRVFFLVFIVKEEKSEVVVEMALIIITDNPIFGTKYTSLPGRRQTDRGGGGKY